jgi:hypothetical protein
VDRVDTVAKDFHAGIESNTGHLKVGLLSTDLPIHDFFHVIDQWKKPTVLLVDFLSKWC